MKQATIVGSGLVGSLWAIYLSKAGYKVNVYERRPDMRKSNMAAGKSINLATSYRGWKALDEVGVGDKIREIAIPMFGRTLHNNEGQLQYQPYGAHNEAIYSVSRGAINSLLMSVAEENASLFFNQECIYTDLDNGICHFKNTVSGEISEVKSDLVFAADGAFSAVRYHSMQKTDRFSYSQNYIEDGYREILLPANADGSYKLEKNSLHIWPRGKFMLIALPNLDGSFTCTLFMPFEGDEYCFNNLDSKNKVNDFFKNLFPDFYKLLPDVAESWDTHPLSSLAIIRCYPWSHGCTVLMGDAAHGTVPFFGQGMNCGFEDCSVMWSLMNKHGEDWTKIFNEYQRLRKPNGDAVQDLSVQNYLVMRDKVADPDYLFQQSFERRISQIFPDKYFSLYSMVSFSDIEYQTALKTGNVQNERIAKIINDYKIDSSTPSETIDSIIKKEYGD